MMCSRVFWMKCDETLFRVFDISSQLKLNLRSKWRKKIVKSMSTIINKFEKCYNSGEREGIRATKQYEED